MAIRRKSKKQLNKNDVFVKQHDLVNEVRKNQGMSLDSRKVIKKRKLRLRKKRLFIVLLFLISSIGMGYYMYSPYSNIKNIHIKGNNIVDYYTIINAANLKVGKKIFWMWESYTKNQILKQAFIESAEIRRDFFEQVVYIEVVETKVVGYTDTNQIIDYKGDITNVEEGLLANIANVPMIVGIVDNQMLKKLGIALGGLDETVWNMISEIIYANDKFDNEMLNILLTDNKKVVITIDDMVKKMGHLPTLSLERRDECTWYFSYGQYVIGDPCEE